MKPVLGAMTLLQEKLHISPIPPDGLGGWIRMELLHLYGFLRQSSLIAADRRGGLIKVGCPLKHVLIVTVKVTFIVQDHCALFFFSKMSIGRTFF